MVRYSRMRGLPSRFGRSFRVSSAAGKLPLRIVNNLGTEDDVSLDVKRIHFRSNKVSPDVSTWRPTHSTSLASFFRLPNGIEIVVKPELMVYPKIGKLGRMRSGFRHMLPVLTELIRRHVRIERPMAFIEMKDGHFFYAVRREPGVQIRSYFGRASRSKRILVARSMGRALAELHQKGVVHMHPHFANWMVHQGRVRLVDVKAVVFREDFPHTYKISGRVHTWEGAMQDDSNMCENEFPSEFKSIFRKAYTRAMAIKK